jgi:hypothetical protein
MSAKYMGQIMAECDCPRMLECQAAGECVAAKTKEVLDRFDDFMRQSEKARWFILWEKAGMPT